jgi:carboxylate-amine ligase
LTIAPHLRDEHDYERRIAALLATGVVMDRGQLYWQMRLSDRYPTIEVRVADVALDVDSLSRWLCWCAHSS